MTSFAEALDEAAGEPQELIACGERVLVDTATIAGAFAATAIAS